MLDKLHITPQEIEEVLYHFAATSSIPKTAALTGIRVDRVRAVVFNPIYDETVDDLRRRMRISVISKIEETQAVLLDALQDDHKLGSASLREISGVFSEISSAQLNLLTASREAVGPSASAVDPSQIFTGDEMEFMALMSRRLQAAPATPSISANGHNEFSGHEMVDVAYGVDPSSTPLDPGYEPLPEIKPIAYDPTTDPGGD